MQGLSVSHIKGVSANFADGEIEAMLEVLNKNAV